MVCLLWSTKNVFNCGFPLNRTADLWRNKERVSPRVGVSVCVEGAWEPSSHWGWDIPAAMLHTMGRAASPHSSVTPENVLRDGKGNVISCAHKLWREREKGVGNLPVWLRSTCMWAGLGLDRGVRLQLGTARAVQVQWWEGWRGGCYTFPKWLFWIIRSQHIKPLGCWV